VLGHCVVSFPSRPAAPGPPGRKRRHPLNSDHAYTENRTDPLGRIVGGAGHRITGDRSRQGSSKHGARSVGWEYVHIAIDDHSRLAYAEVLADEKASTAVGFLRRAVAYYQRRGIEVERILTDNGSCYRATIHALACRALRIKHSRP
jgi:transposase InsO family protein